MILAKRVVDLIITSTSESSVWQYYVISIQIEIEGWLKYEKK